MPKKGYKQTEEHKIKGGLASKRNTLIRLETMRKNNSFYRPFGEKNPMKRFDVKERVRK